MQIDVSAFGRLRDRVEDEAALIHIVGGVVLAIVFAVGTTRPINLGALSLAATFLVGTFMVGESAREMASGFPVDLFIVLTGVTYLFAIAANNGTVERVVDGAVRLSGARRRPDPVGGVRRRLAARRWPARLDRPAWRCWPRSRCGWRSAARSIAG